MITKWPMIDEPGNYYQPSYMPVASQVHNPLCAVSESSASAVVKEGFITTADTEYTETAQRT